MGGVQGPDEIVWDVEIKDCEVEINKRWKVVTDKNNDKDYKKKRTTKKE